MKSLLPTLASKALAISVFYLASATIASAECDNIRCVGQIERLLVGASRIGITTDGDESKLNCELSNSYISLEFEHKAFREIYAALLAAKTGNIDVNIRIVEGSDNCAISYVRID